MDKLKNWILRLMLGVMAVVLWWMIRTGVEGIYTRLDQMIIQNKELAEKLIQQSGEIQNIKLHLSTNDKRLDDHADRLREVELNQAKCLGNGE